VGIISSLLPPLLNITSTCRKEEPLAPMRCQFRIQIRRVTVVCVRRSFHRQVSWVSRAVHYYSKLCRWAHSRAHEEPYHATTRAYLYNPSKLAYNSHVFSIYLIYTIMPKIFTVPVCTCTYNVGQGLTYRNNWLNITGTPCTNSIIYNVD
jgi:hypothetical protein